MARFEQVLTIGKQLVYMSQQRTKNRTKGTDLPVLLDPALLRAARQIYRTYFEVRSDRSPRPTGVAINRFNHRGKLIFSSEKPILLPQECFVPFSQIESENS